MRWIVKALLVWGIFDSFWLGRDSKRWLSFWSGTMDKLADHPKAAKALAGAQMALCLWLLKKI